MKYIFKIFLLSLLFFGTLSANNICEKKLFSFTVDDDSITILDVLENLASTCKMSIIFKDQKSKDEASKKINYINVTDFSLNELLDMLLTDHNLFYSLEKNGKVLKIASTQTKTFLIDYISFSKRKSSTSKTIKTGASGGEGGDDSTTVNFTSEFKFWDNIEKEIRNIFKATSTNREEEKENEVFINQDAGTVTVTGTPLQIKKIGEYLDTILKRLHKQVLIDTKILEITFDNEHTSGINWSKFQLSLHGSSDAHKSRQNGVESGSFSYPNYLIGYNFSVEALMKFLKTQGKVSIVSNPKILTLNNQPAVINVGKEVNYRYSTGTTVTTSNGTTTTTPSYEVDSTFVGITLDIVPEITENNSIILKINPVVSEIADEHRDSNGVPYLAPDIKIKQLSSIVKVKNGKKILLGGLIQKRSEVKNNKVPILGSIPLIKYAFSSKEKRRVKSELIMIITPYIIENDKPFPKLTEFEKYFEELEKE